MSNPKRTEMALHLNIADMRRRGNRWLETYHARYRPGSSEVERDGSERERDTACAHFAEHGDEDLVEVVSDEDVDAWLEDNRQALAEEMEAAEAGRAVLVKEASELLSGRRNEDHGPSTTDLDTIARLWTVLLQRKLRDDAAITAADVGILVIALELARTVQARSRDAFVDIAGRGSEQAQSRGAVRGAHRPRRGRASRATLTRP